MARIFQAVLGVLVLAVWQIGITLAELSASVTMTSPARRRTRAPGAAPADAAARPVDDRSAA